MKNDSFASHFKLGGLNISALICQQERKPCVASGGPQAGDGGELGTELNALLIQATQMSPQELGIFPGIP